MRSPLKLERERRGWTLEYVAKQVGVSGAQISRIESEGVKAAETAKAISDLFGGLSLEEICFGERVTKKPARSARLQRVAN